MLGEQASALLPQNRIECRKLRGWLSQAKLITLPVNRDFCPHDLAERAHGNRSSANMRARAPFFRHAAHHENFVVFHLCAQLVESCKNGRAFFKAHAP